MRTYSAAHLSAFPSWQGVESWPLPDQDQGEGVALAGDELLVKQADVELPVFPCTTLHVQAALDAALA